MPFAGPPEPQLCPKLDLLNLNYAYKIWTYSLTNMYYYNIVFYNAMWRIIYRGSGIRLLCRSKKPFFKMFLGNYKVLCACLDRQNNH